MVETEKTETPGIEKKTQKYRVELTVTLGEKKFRLSMLTLRPTRKFANLDDFLRAHNIRTASGILASWNNKRIDIRTPDGKSLDEVEKKTLALDLQQAAKAQERESGDAIGFFFQGEHEYKDPTKVGREKLAG